MTTTHYISRTLEPVIQEITEQFPVLLVTGPRQVGKTSLLHHLSGKIRSYVTLDNPHDAALAQNEPEFFLEKYAPPVLIDEIQYAPQLFRYIKMIVDKSQQSGLFWLTGSQPFLLMKGISESLAGRIAIVDLLGLSQKEMAGHPMQATPFLPIKDLLFDRLKSSSPGGLKATYDRIWRGSFPRVIQDPKMKPTTFFNAYIQTYLQRDVQDIKSIEDTSAFLRFLKVAAARTAQIINIADMARDADISPNTAKSWLSILETSGIIYFLKPYFTSVTKRLVKAPKLYFLDTGLCAYLAEWLTPETLELGAMSGPIFETYVFTEILKSYWHNGLEAPLYYYRDKDQKEIDLLISQNNILYPIEIKKTGSPTKDAIRHFSVLDHLRCNRGEGGLICLTDSLLPLGDKNYAIPVSSL